MIKHFKFLVGTTGWRFYAVILCGAVTGSAGAGIIALAHQKLKRNDFENTELLGLFVTLWIVFGLCACLTDHLLIKFAQKIVYDLRLSLCEQVLSASLRSIEKVGNNRILAILTEDVNTVSETVESLPSAVINTAIMAGCYAYMATLSPKLFILTMLCFLTGMLAYKVPLHFASRAMTSVRETSNLLYKDFHALTHGTKELLLHRPRREEFMRGRIGERSEKMMEESIKGKSIWRFFLRWGDLFSLMALGGVLFVFPHFITADKETLTGFVIAGLFSMGPLAAVLSFLPRVTRSAISLKQIEFLGFSLAREPSLALTSERESREIEGEGAILELRDIAFTYHGFETGDRFEVGPISHTFQSGQITYMIGGNGSGKSTLAKIICGLYFPESGQIFCRGQEITDENREAFRQNFSAIFSDFFLFEELPGKGTDALNEKATEFLRTMQLEGKVEVTDGKFSNLSLSQGQRKRLALLSACLEDRPFYVFDEWAADQDPLFKDFFYRNVLPELKLKNKAILVITHDDKYFPLADRVIRLDFGKMEAAPSQMELPIG